MKTVTLPEAQQCLYDLINLADKGEDIFIIHDKLPKIELVIVDEPPKKRVFGQHMGKAWISPDFDAPLPDDFWGTAMKKKLLLDTHTMVGCQPRKIIFSSYDCL